MGKILLMGLIAGLGTCLGALLVLVMGHIYSKTFSFFLGLAAGVMLAVIFLDLLPSALHYGSLILSLKGFFTGLLIIAVMDFIFNRITIISMTGHRYLVLGYLIVSGIALHDLPEGLAIAAGFAEPLSLGSLLTIAIGLHNIPEGMATAAPLRAGGMNPAKILWINILLSLVTPAGCALGMVLINISPLFISFLLAFAGGAMGYIAIIKLLPESLQRNIPFSLIGIILGIIFTLLLNLLLQQ